MDILKVFLYTFLFVFVAWLATTVYTQFSGKGNLIELEPFTEIVGEAAVIYNPDPFSDFDEQVSIQIAKGLQSAGYKVVVVPTNEDVPDLALYDLTVLCANTYNFAPDWNVATLIKNRDWQNHRVAAVTLGAGETNLAAKQLKGMLKNAGAEIIGDAEFWLMKPNDENYNAESNRQAAKEKAYRFAIEISQTLATTL